MNPADRIVVNPVILPGKPLVRGTRLSVQFVVGLLADGWSEADVLRNYPNLSHEDIVACFRYAADVLRAEKLYPLATA